MEKMIKISAIILAKNEEKNLGRCLNSLKQCCDEIIVIVDSSTTDKSIEVIKTFPEVKYLIRDWEGFARTKQYAISLTANNWVLWFDADESLSPALIAEINNFKNETPDLNVYAFPRKANFLGKWILHSGWYPGYVNRLFNKNNVKFSDSLVHEHLLFEGGTGRFKNDIEHYTDPNIHHYYEKFNNYTSLAAVELNSSKKTFKKSDIILRPLFIFIKMYILKKGFLDGLQGFILAVFSSNYVFTKYCKLWELQRENKL